MNVPWNLKDLGSCWDSRRLRSFDNLFGELNRLSEESSLLNRNPILDLQSLLLFKRIEDWVKRECKEKLQFNHYRYVLFFAVLEDLPSSMKMNCSFWIICIESDFLRWGYCYKSAYGFVVLIKVISFVIVLSLPLWIATPRLHTATCSLLRAMMSTWYASPRVVTSWLAGFQ